MPSKESPETPRIPRPTCHPEIGLAAPVHQHPTMIACVAVHFQTETGKITSNRKIHRPLAPARPPRPGPRGHPGGGGGRREDRLAAERVGGAVGWQESVVRVELLKTKRDRCRL